MFFGFARPKPFKRHCFQRTDILFPRHCQNFWISANCAHNRSFLATENIMILQASTKPNLLRVDSCASAEIKKSLVSKIFDEPAPPSRKSKRNNKGVCFNDRVGVRTTEHINDFTPEEVANTWYQKVEYKMMKAEFAVTVQKLFNGEYTGDTEHHCARGLEHKPRVCANRRRARRMDSLVAVLDEQERQFCESSMGTIMKEDSATALATVYEKACGSSTREASLRGELDAEEASRIRTGKESLTALVFTAKKFMGDQKTSQPNEVTPSGKGRIRNLFRKRRSR